MTLEKDPLNLIIAGVGGQGNILASQIVATAGTKEWLYVTVSETYGASQRGGPVMSHVRFSAKAQCGPLIPEGEADIIVGLEPIEALRIIADYGNPNTRVIVSPRPIYPIWVLSGQATYPPVDEIIGKLEELADRVQVVNAGSIHYILQQGLNKQRGFVSDEDYLPPCEGLKNMEERIIA